MEQNEEQQIKLFDTRDILQYSLFALVLVSFAVISFDARSTAVPTQVIVAATPPTVPLVTIRKDPFANPDLAAQAAFVIDVNTGHVLYEDNADIPLPLASLTKLMTALTAAESTDTQESMQIEPAALRAEGDSGLLAYERWRISDLIDYTLVVSSNDGAKALALTLGALPVPEAGGGPLTIPQNPEERFIKRMNDIAGRLNLRNTHFNNETGLDETKQQGGSYGSARDVATLMAYILEKKPELLNKTREGQSVFTSLGGYTHPAHNTNPAVDYIPGILGSKTGFTDLAGGNLTIAFDASFGEPIIVVVLGSTPERRIADVDTLAAAARAQLTLDQ